ncbi:unnamed protein product [Ostreobium quekettii]|uniref:Uncharacterized protein n=1 Tax=Ostreobium quekettii TaxID=121088 RepID=A0A8S1IRW5_9CHLO|nr:unnamed protein product [Ostreobium quekettii]
MPDCGSGSQPRIDVGDACKVAFASASRKKLESALEQYSEDTSEREKCRSRAKLLRIALIFSLLTAACGAMLEEVCMALVPRWIQLVGLVLSVLRYVFLAPTSMYNEFLDVLTDDKQWWDVVGKMEKRKKINAAIDESLKEGRLQHIETSGLGFWTRKILQFGELMGTHLPANISNELRDALEKRGLNVRTQQGDVDAAWNSATIKQGAYFSLFMVKDIIAIIGMKKISNKLLRQQVLAESTIGANYMQNLVFGILLMVVVRQRLAMGTGRKIAIIYGLAAIAVARAVLSFDVGTDSWSIARFIDNWDLHLLTFGLWFAATIYLFHRMRSSGRISSLVVVTVTMWMTAQLFAAQLRSGSLAERIDFDGKGRSIECMDAYKWLGNILP